MKVNQVDNQSQTNEHNPKCPQINIRSQVVVFPNLHQHFQPLKNSASLENPHFFQSNQQTLSYVTKQCIHFCDVYLLVSFRELMIVLFLKFMRAGMLQI